MSGEISGEHALYRAAEGRGQEETWVIQVRYRRVLI